MRFVDPKTSDTSRGSVDSLPAAGAQDFGWEADVTLMFRRLSEPLPLSEASLLALRPALNAPVLNVGFLPVGPARAAIVVFAEEWGGIGLALGIRSNEAGRVAVFRNQESIAPDVTIQMPSSLLSLRRNGWDSCSMRMWSPPPRTGRGAFRQWRCGGA